MNYNSLIFTGLPASRSMDSLYNTLTTDSSTGTSRPCPVSPVVKKNEHPCPVSPVVKKTDDIITGNESVIAVGSPTSITDSSIFVYMNELNKK